MKIRLIHKLLIALFACTATVLIVVTLITRANIGRGFVDFLQMQDQARLEALAPVLAEWHDHNGGWQALRENPTRFRALLMSALPRELAEANVGGRFGQGPPGQRGGSGLSSGGNGPYGPGGGRMNSLGQRVYLLDAARQPVAGTPARGDEASRLIAVGPTENPLGWLGMAQVRGIELPEEEAFLLQLRHSLTIGLALGLGLAVLLGGLLARHLSRPVNAIADGIRSLAAGDLDTVLPESGGDEIARLARDVNRLSMALREHESARNRWMSDIAHELRTPLSIIAGELDAMLDGVRPTDQAHLLSLQEEVRHLNALIDDLRSLALTDSGALAYQMEALDFSETVCSAVSAMAGAAERRDLSLNLAGAGKPCRLNGDEQRLRQLLHNLLDNAIRYTDPGGRISVSLAQDNGSARLVVSDSEPGVSPEDSERLFDRLFRVDASRNRHSGGSGLGLAICRNIAEAHGGRITAEPGPDGGLQVTVSLPTGP